MRDALTTLGSAVITKTISPGDYVLSNSCAAERKTFNDFLRSIYDGRLFDQVARLAAAYENPFLILEGDVAQALGIRNPGVFWAALAKIAVRHRVQVICTPNLAQTALFIYSLAQKLHTKNEPQSIIANQRPRVFTISQKQMRSVQSLPNVGQKKAEVLLRRFGSIRRVFQASKEELNSTVGLGAKVANEIEAFLDTEFHPS